MRIQMSALQRILDAGRRDRENPLLLHTFRTNFDSALKQVPSFPLSFALIDWRTVGRPQSAPWSRAGGARASYATTTCRAASFM
jgi:hypothetical protein